MRHQAIVDTGPLVAILNANDTHHDWAVSQIKELNACMMTCEAVLSEAFFLMRSIPGAKENLWKMIQHGGVRTGYCLDAKSSDEHSIVSRLMLKYSNVPMSFADACLVRMSELFPKKKLLTLDSDFKIYRKKRNQLIPLISP